MSQNQSTNPESHSSIERDYTKNKNLNKIIAGIVLALVIVSGGVMLKNKQSPNNDTSNTPAEEVDSNVPREARDFVKNYGDRYADPVSTYYAEKAYEKANNGKSLILTDEYIKNYVPIEVKGGTIPNVSDHGFTYYNLPKSTELNTQSAIKMFNEYYAPETELLINLLAKNPSPEARAIIKAEFIRYTSSDKNVDDDYTNNLIQFATDVANKGGSNANYDIAPLTNETADKDNANVSYVVDFETPSTWKQEYYPGSEKMDSMSIGLNRIVVSIESFNVKTPSNNKETSYNFQIDFMRRTAVSSDTTTPITIGLVQSSTLYP